MTDAPGDAPKNKSKKKSRWTLIALLAAGVWLIAIVLIAVFARGGPVEYADDTPEGVVQRYSQAVIDGDTRTALDYLVPELADDCERQQPGTDDLRVTLVETTERDDTARVEVIVATVFESGPFGTNEYRSEEIFDLVREGGQWYVDVAPWQLTICFDDGIR
ncbi:hypothetical protein [Microbacterium immunditiarum]|uniref:Lipoprotein LpqB N-terminal domain-containing protein n=1 Tax=Microbacterium immunditiarum TaxID=337480 RepID=A0A7Y9GMY5_9MICO|nr:hypothetical protein [Microbacterium immunditiarum]NYE19473.1 hypothetical protein [Microbacterium immunditiarum]